MKLQTAIPSSCSAALFAALLTSACLSPAAHAADTSSFDGKKGSLTVGDQHSEIGIPSVIAKWDIPRRGQPGKPQTKAELGSELGHSPT